MRNLVLVVAIAACVAVPLHARAQSEGSAYDALVREAVVEYNAGNWAEARLLFGKAHALEPNARTWRGMGLTDYEAKRYVEAIQELSAALDSDVKALTEAQRAEVEQGLERSRRFVAIYTLKLPTDATGLRLDGKPVSAASDGTLRVNPGVYVLRVHRTSGPPIELRFEAEVGARGTLELEMLPADHAAASAHAPPDERAARSSDDDDSALAWTWVAGGATLAFGAATIAFGVLTLDAHDAFEARVAAGKPAEDLKQDGQRYQLLTNVALGVTAAAAITTVVLFIVEGGSTDERASADGFQVDVGLGAIAVRGAL